MKRSFSVLIAGLLLAAVAFAATPGSNPLLRELPQVRFPEENRVVAGAIDAADIDRLREAGIRHVVNLRPPEENPGFDEGRTVNTRGLMYHAIPIKGGESLTKENVQAFDKVLEEIGEEPALVHCSSGNRVGALIALREAWLKGAAHEAAIAEGKQWGLTRLEGTVRKVLSNSGQ